MYHVYVGVFAGEGAKKLDSTCKTWREVNLVRQRVGVLDAKSQCRNMTTFIYDINNRFVCSP